MQGVQGTYTRFSHFFAKWSVIKSVKKDRIYPAHLAQIGFLPYPHQLFKVWFSRPHGGAPPPLIPPITGWAIGE